MLADSILENYYKSSEVSINENSREIEAVDSGLAYLAKSLRKTAPASAKEFTKLRNKFKDLLKQSNQETVNYLIEKISVHKGKEFKIPWLGMAKLETINSAYGTSYFVQFSNDKGYFNISHKENGSWDSRVKIGSEKMDSYGPHGNHKFPDFDGLMKKIAKLKTR